MPKSIEDKEKELKEHIQNLLNSKEHYVKEHLLATTRLPKEKWDQVQPREGDRYLILKDSATSSREVAEDRVRRDLAFLSREIKTDHLKAIEVTDEKGSKMWYAAIDLSKVTVPEDFDRYIKSSDTDSDLDTRKRPGKNP